MARFERTIHIEAPASDVWAVMMDLEAWPAWASQFKRLERMDGGPVKVGSRVRVRPTRLPASVWLVTEYEDGRSFTWKSTAAPGVHLIGGHALTPDSRGTNAAFWLEATGILGRLLSPILHSTFFSRNTRNATEGLKKRVEANVESSERREPAPHA